MDPVNDRDLLLTRRHFFGLCSCGIGAAALGSLLNPQAFAALANSAGSGGALKNLHFPPRAKRIIYLFMSGGPSQLDLFDYKPGLVKLQGTDLPDSIRNGQRLTGMTSGQAHFPVASTIYKFAQHGQSGALVSELLPHTAKIADGLCFIRTVNTEAINHDPAITFFQTGSQLPGRPSMGAWLTYGLGTMNDNLPGFVVMLSRTDPNRGAQALFDRLWGSGFLPSEYQGVKFRSGHDPVLYLSDPPGIDKPTRRRMLDAVAKLNSIEQDAFADPEINARISQYEMAYRMQTSIPELTDVSDEPESTFALYGDEARKPGSYASNCLLARRLAERGVRFIQLYHRDWDQHGNLPSQITMNCKDTDQATAGLITDLKQRGMLEDTLVIWAGEFGRTVYCQGDLKPDNYGRDHHGRCFTVWLAGGGVKPGVTHGETDDFCYNIVKDPVHVHDLNATILRLMGIDHERLTYNFQGRDFRLTDVAGKVVEPILA
ncbi:MAG: DUF1501 domain-containing protein [Candidatus Hydrogenedentes bacterium]|nr:DUF1501 domain-containing protein [Candidatus Hydrogenedentota bacterium]